MSARRAQCELRMISRLSVRPFFCGRLKWRNLRACKVRSFSCCRTLQRSWSSSSSIYLQMVGDCGLGVTPCTFLFTDTVRVLFGCSESSMRIMNELGIRVPKITDVFTLGTSHSYDGLLGVLVFSSSVEHSTPIAIHGLSGVDSFLDACDSFKKRKHLNSTFHELSSDVANFADVNFADASVTTPVRVGNELVVHPVLSHMEKGLFAVPRYSLSYICQLLPGQGQFCSERAVQLGVPKPFWGDLSERKSVVLEGGRKVDPESVLGPLEPRPSFLVLDLTCARAASSTLASLGRSLRDLIAKDPLVYQLPSLLVLYTSLPVWQGSGSLFPVLHSLLSPDVRVVLVDTGNTNSNARLFNSSLLLRDQLGSVSRKFFPSPASWKEFDGCERQLESESTTSRALDGMLTTSSACREVQAGSDLRSFVLNALGPKTSPVAEKEDKVHLAENGLKYHILPADQRGIEVYFPEPLPSRPDSSLKGAREVDGSGYRVAPGGFVQGRDPKLVFLGTGGSLPTKRRNVSGLHIALSPESSLLVDCGEGTCRQMLNHYGQRFDDVIKSIDVIYITHMHIDHHLGLRTLLKLVSSSRQKEPAERPHPLLIGPIDLYRFLKTCFRNGDAYLKEALSRFYVFKRIMEDVKVERSPIRSFMNKNNLVQFEPVAVDHGPPCYGLVMKHDSGWKLAHSSDTRPCMRLGQAAHGATLLIHDSTYEDDRLAEARKHYHSTVSQALSIAKTADVKHVILTHFSQRYLLPTVDLTNVKSGSLGVAFDHMEVHLSELEELCSLTSAVYSELGDLIKEKKHR